MRIMAHAFRVLVGFAMCCGVAQANDLHALMGKCIPEVHPTTMGAIVRAESTGYMYILSDDGPGHLPWSQRKSMLRSFNPSTLEEATTIARGLIQQGHWVGLGLTQLASRHLPKLGLSIEQALDPCTNLREGGRVLVNFYIDAMKKYQNPQDALYAAISAYNTGNFGAGFSNGYVQKVVNAAGYTVPALQAGKPQRAKALANTTSRPQGVRVASPRTSLDARFAKLEAENF